MRSPRPFQELLERFFNRPDRTFHSNGSVNEGTLVMTISIAQTQAARCWAIPMSRPRQALNERKVGVEPVSSVVGGRHAAKPAVTKCELIE